MSSIQASSRGHQEGISATPGTFAFREIRLEEGGTLRVAVTTDGRPARGVTCQVLEYEANPIGPARVPAVHSESVTSAGGVCLSSRVAEGPYTLRLKIQGKRTFVDRSVTVVNGQETAVNVPLSTIRVSGTAMKGDKPAASYAVSFLDRSEIKPNGTRRDAQAEATTDEDGKYEAVLWSPGDYFARLDTPEGTPADIKRVSLQDREEQVDFHLEDQDVRGVVLDDRDRPIPRGPGHSEAERPLPDGEHRREGGLPLLLAGYGVSAGWKPSSRATWTGPRRRW